jgi:hypothetical protein
MEFVRPLFLSGKDLTDCRIFIEAYRFIDKAIQMELDLRHLRCLLIR